MKLLKTTSGETLAINFVMEKHGWARLEFALDEQELCIFLSCVFDPFDDLKQWINDVENHHLPAEIDIDEEGWISTLVALPNTEENMGFLVKDNYNKPIINVIVNRERFAEKFRTELERFFAQDFDPEHW